MSNIQILAMVLAAVVGFVLATVVFIPLLKKKGVDGQQIIDTAQAGLATADKIVDGVQAALPSLPGISLVHEIIDLSEKAATAAEQLWQSSQMTTDQRKETATKLVTDCLTVANVEVTPDVAKIIDGAVEAAVFALPKTDKVITPVATETPTEAAVA